MKMSKLLNNIFVKFIIFSLFHLIYSDTDECEISYYNDITYPKADSLSNGNKIMITPEGIYSFIPSLSRAIYSYKFNDTQKITTGLIEEIFLSQICQFSNENGGDEYVLCYIKNTIFILNKNGKVLFSKSLDFTISSSDSISLLCYKYDQVKDSYIFIIVYNLVNNNIFSKLLIISYNLFVINENQGSVTLVNNKTYFPEDYIDGYSLIPGGISCRIMIKDSSNVIACFLGITIQNNNKPLCSLEIDPNTFQISKGGTIGDQSMQISSSIGKDKSKALVCLLNSSGSYKCYSYDINQQKFSENEIFEMDCQMYNYAIYASYFSDSNEFIISCLDYSNNYNMKKIDDNFNLVNEEYLYKANFNCYTFYSFSVVYANKYKEYILVVYGQCDFINGLRFFELSNNCDIGNIKGASDNLEENEEENIETQKQLNPNLFSNSSLSYIYRNNETLISRMSDKLSELGIEEISNISEKNGIIEKLSEKQIYPHLINTQEIASDNIKKTNIETNKPTIIDSLYNTEKEQKEEIVSDHLAEDKKTDHNNEQINFTNSDNISNFPKLPLTDSKTNALEFHSDNLTEKINQLKSDSDNEKTENLSFSDKSTSILNFETNKKTIEFFKTDTTKEGINKSDYISQNININTETPKTDISTQIRTYSEDTKNIKIETDIVCQSDKNKKISEKCICNEDFPYLLFPSQQCTNLCSVEQLMDQTCKIDCVSEESFKVLIQNIETMIKDDTFDDDKEIIIVGNNVICDITTTQTKQTYTNISYIDFGECETKLKQKYNINYLLILKFDKINENSPTSIEYEVYDPTTKDKLDLSICNTDKISIDIPMTLDEHSLDLYKNFSSLGYDIFDKNDRFYNDICTKFSSEDETDVLLIDRRATYYNDSIIFCESGCDYSGYNAQTKLVKCKCEVKKNISTNINIIGFERNNISSFFDFKTYMNLEVIKCYKTLFCKDGFIKNYGNYIMLFMAFIYLIIMICFYIKYKKNLRNLILQVHPKYKFDKISSPPPKIHKTSKNNKSRDITSKESIIKKNKLKKSKEKIDNKNKMKKKTKMKDNAYKIQTKERSLDSSQKKFKVDSPKGKKNKSKLNLDSEIKIYKKKIDKPILKKMNDEEINYLTYEEAILFDKRTYCQYYFSLLKKKHIILFIFITQNDYNLIYIKLCFFILSIGLYFTINALFYTDKTMHKVYQSKGQYDFIFQLPKLFYSSFITFLINAIIKSFALSEKNILYLKQFKEGKKLDRKVREVLKCLEIKFNIFFIVGLIFLCIFWYYISVFCSVYVNTQIILIKNTILSFGISLLYPFFLNLFPGIFRFPSLKSRKSPCLYNFSKIISLL